MIFYQDVFKADLMKVLRNLTFLHGLLHFEEISAVIDLVIQCFLDE